MQADNPDRARLRRLAEFAAEDGQVVSLYLDLSPSEFGTSRARRSEVRSLLDRANRDLGGRDDLSHEELAAAKKDLARVEELLANPPTEGAHALAVFCASAGDGLLEVLKLPRGVESSVVIDRSPYIEPLLALVPSEAWGIVLANRRLARYLRGSRDALRDLGRFEDDTHGQHDQGGWSQARYQRSVDKEAKDHLRAAADTAYRLFRRAPVGRLLIAGPREIHAELEGMLRSDLRERVAGHLEIDVANSTPEDVLVAARPLMEAREQQIADDAIGRLRAELGNGGGAAGLADVLNAANERRLETVLVEEGFRAAGKVCPRCASLWTEEAERCPADGAPLERREDVVEDVVERAISQSAGVLTLRERPELGPHGGIAALLRF